jgi:hypothetical protein
MSLFGATYTRLAWLVAGETGLSVGEGANLAREAALRQIIEQGLALPARARSTSGLELLR